MTFRVSALAAAVLLGGVVGLRAADPPKSVRFPADPVAQQPQPKPVDSASPQKLAKGQWYVIASAKPLLILPTGAGEVSLTQRKGPFTIPSEFVIGYPPDQNDPEVVTFVDEYLYVVKAVRSGPVALQVIPALNILDDKGKQLPLKMSDIVVKKVQVETGAGPQPPPEPDPKPKPDPEPDVTPAKLIVVIVDETSDRATALRGKLLFDPVIAAHFQEKGHAWRVLDRDVVGADGKPPKDVERFLKMAADKPYPSYYLVDPTGKVRGSGAVPAKNMDFLELVRRAGG